jgi:hypothetical protein
VRFRIQEDDAERIASNTRRDQDPLDIRRTTVDGVRGVADDMLAGHRTIPPGVPLLPIDEVGVAILVHLGINPVAAAALASEANGIGIEDEAGNLVGEVLMDILPPFHVSFDGLRWDGEALYIPALPETVRTRLPCDDEFDEVPLVQVVSHPALDPLRADIMWVEDDPRDDARQKLVLTCPNRAQTRQEMETAWERGRRRRSGEA